MSEKSAMMLFKFDLIQGPVIDIRWYCLLAPSTVWKQMTHTCVKTVKQVRSRIFKIKAYLLRGDTDQLFNFQSIWLNHRSSNRCIILEQCIIIPLVCIKDGNEYSTSCFWHWYSFELRTHQYGNSGPVLILLFQTRICLILIHTHHMGRLTMSRMLFSLESLKSLKLQPRVWQHM